MAVSISEWEILFEHEELGANIETYLLNLGLVALYYLCKGNFPNIPCCKICLYVWILSLYPLPTFHTIIVALTHWHSIVIIISMRWRHIHYFHGPNHPNIYLWSWCLLTCSYQSLVKSLLLTSTFKQSNEFYIYL